MDPANVELRDVAEALTNIDRRLSRIETVITPLARTIDLSPGEPGEAPAEPILGGTGTVPAADPTSGGPTPTS